MAYPDAAVNALKDKLLSLSVERERRAGELQQWEASMLRHHANYERILSEIAQIEQALLELTGQKPENER